MAGDLRITLLADRTASREDLETEAGLSFLVERGGDVLLFDAGETGAALRNAERLGLPWRRAARIVVSHGHKDHTGGLADFLPALPEAHVHLHPRALSPKWRVQPGLPPRDLSMPPAVQARLQERMDRLHWVTAPMALGPGMGLTGPVPRRRAPLDPAPGFYLDPEGRVPDPLEDDQALWIATGQGTVAVLGCAHAGVEDTLDRIRALAGPAPFRAILGGFHLAGVPETAFGPLLQALETERDAWVAPVHCTGPAAAQAIARVLGPRARRLQVGESLVL